jgi:TonB family protein
VSRSRVLFAFLSAMMIFSSFCFADQLKDRLNAEFKNKSYLIKGFPQDTKLEIDSHFQPTKRWHEGSWTLANMLVEDVKANDRNVEFSGHRVGFLYDAKQGKMIKVKLNEEIGLKIKDVAGMNPDDLIRNIRTQILLSDVKDIAHVLPDPWKPYFEGDFKPDAEGKIHFHPPGLVADSTVDKRRQSLEVAGKLADGEMLYKVTADKVDAPKPIHTPDPQYPEIARKTRTEGAMVLWAIVGKAGNVDRVYVQRPLGLGLDEEAIAAVEKWKFQPARRNGEPVAVQINVEVNFRLN